MAVKLRGALSMLGLSAALVASCKEAPPAYPSATIDIETDLPVPRVLSRLQVDLYDERGQWFESRRFPLAAQSDVPTSFGIVLRDDARRTSVLVRVRGYAEGAERDYRGERFVERKAWVPPKTPQTIAELCQEAPELLRNETRVLRAGPKALFKETCDQLTNFSGSVAAKITITEKGRYHFGVIPMTTADTAFRVADSVSLHLVRDCLKPEASLGCSVEVDLDGGSVGNIETELEPGSYAMVTGAWLPTSTGDIALKWTRAEDWTTPQRPILVDPPGDEAIVPVPLEVVGGLTPTTEPAPDATVDRLVRLELRPGEPQHARVVLAGACAGTMAKLAIVNGHVDVGASLACKPESGALEPVTNGDANGASGLFADDPCSPDDSDENVVCVPGGAIALGSSSTPLPGNVTENPLRIAGVSKFWMDRYELTVARYRAAVKDGFEASIPREVFGPEANEGNIVQNGVSANGTYSAAPRGREEFPLSVVSWLTSRELCKHLGGDLPSEAQWEYAASWSPTAKRAYAWGDAPPTCDLAVSGRQNNGKFCSGPTLVAVTDDAMLGDTSALGIVGLSGNLAEWTLGSPRAYDDPCFRGAPILNPVCLDPTTPGRVARGGDWRHLPQACRTVLRRRHNAASQNGAVGFRCVYTSRPSP